MTSRGVCLPKPFFQLKVFSSKPLGLASDQTHTLCPPFSEQVPLSAQIILFIGAHENLAMLPMEILESVAACVENGGVFILMDGVTRQCGLPVPRQHRLSSSRGYSPLATSFLSQLPLKVDAKAADRITPRQALAATLAPGARTILYSKKLHPATLCCTSCQQIVGSFHGEVTKTSDRVCLLCEFHDGGMSGCQPLAASARFGKGSILHIALTLGDNCGLTTYNIQYCRMIVYYRVLCE